MQKRSYNSPVSILRLRPECVPRDFQRRKSQDWDLSAKWTFCDSLFVFFYKKRLKMRPNQQGRIKDTPTPHTICFKCNQKKNFLKKKSIYFEYFPKLTFMSNPWSTEISFERWWHDLTVFCEAHSLSLAPLSR